MTNERIFMLVIDGTSNGEYENTATAILFRTHKEAVQYVTSDLADNVVACEGDNLTDEELQAAIDRDSEWYGENEAQYRHGDTIVDYRIEEVSLPK